ncbi:hypothetical protein B0A50_04876 [Salinomyces thailandicus]|uniref:DUF427 domain-containing protein n=1 Tax=Salinomyces thailandicus TaxID=706561 RepID=A0A4U0U105_9PEZI|nr:hypothetical protein B0A50_04876 [Salinomyces thailandica]
MADDDLKQLALRLGTQGPHKTLPTPRLIQLLHAGHNILRTTNAVYVWENPFYPQYYLPAAELLANHEDPAHPLTITQGEAITAPDDRNTVIAHHWILTLPSHQSPITRVLAFSPHLSNPKAAAAAAAATAAASPLANLVKIDFPSIATWLEETLPIHIHPKNPFTRLDVLPSMRKLKISHSGRILAETSYSQHLYETGLPCRYYIPLTAVREGVLKKSERRTGCPYKGEAEYFSVVVAQGLKEEEGGAEGAGEGEGEVVVEDGVWVYWRPEVECAGIGGLVCFMNEKFDIELDGKLLERPDTHFGRKGPDAKPSAV